MEAISRFCTTVMRVTMSKLFPLSCLLLGIFCVHFNDSEAKTYNIATRSLTECPKGSPPSACSKKHLMFSYPRIGRSNGSRQQQGFSRTQRLFGIVSQPRIGRSDPSILQSDNQRNYDSDDLTDLDYQRRAMGERQDYSTSLDNYLAARRSISPWAFFLITPNFQNSEHTVDNIIPQLDRKLEGGDNNEE